MQFVCAVFLFHILQWCNTSRHCNKKRCVTQPALLVLSNVPPLLAPVPPYGKLGLFVLLLPPLRTKQDQDAAFVSLSVLSEWPTDQQQDAILYPHITNPICTSFNRTTSRRVSRIQGILWRWKDDTDALQWPAFDFYLVLTFCGGWVPFKKSAAERLRLMKNSFD